MNLMLYLVVVLLGCIHVDQVYCHTKKVSRALLQICNPGQGQCEPTPYNLVEGGTIVQECSSIENVTVVTGKILVSGLENLAASRKECCRDCFETEKCTLWTYCEQRNGCRLGDNQTYSYENSSANATLPYRGCRLLDSKIPLSNLASNSTLVPSNVPFVTGKALDIFLPFAAGYVTYPGKSLNIQYDYACAYSPGSSQCVLFGTVSELASFCDADPRCRAFVFIPANLMSGNKDVGILKGGVDITTIPSSELTLNTSTYTYLLTEEGYYLTVDPGENQQSNDTLLWIILPTVAGVLFISLIIIAGVFYKLSKQHRDFEKALSAISHSERSSINTSPNGRSTRVHISSSERNNMAFEITEHSSAGTHTTSGPLSSLGTGPSGGRYGQPEDSHSPIRHILGP